MEPIVKAEPAIAIDTAFANLVVITFRALMDYLLIKEVMSAGFIKTQS
ncbi:MAG: hypothetical protein Q7U98_12000 [Methylicorpusculum sp.]|nr:hypothetical protein [Methylicorpusculum sp.]MDO8844301.1 hypothetical protein [Methylicorpusculum sp.]MDO8939870.1 hypothetical protein [Methylicorpusculum sp.]MDO9239447.1 hypothetical protein [Methylicorpusculum sp.]MDP2178777.1 hypothetical protein [Methylicorpusculum sp.]MDP2202491.1 hypothetical protein [Methylicorpusculum sp.]